MAFRSLTDVYILMRNNVIANKNIFHDNQYSDDRTALVIDMENGKARALSKIPPEWTNDVDEIQYDITKIKNKIKELGTLHDKHLNRPTLDDNVDEEKAIDSMTQEITNILNQVHLKIRKISIKNNSSSNQSFTDQRLVTNVVKNLASTLQEMTTNFKKNQNIYLKKIQARKERSNMLFDTTQFSPSLMTEENEFDEDNSSFLNQKQEQLQISRANRQMLNEREQEITHIVKSIQDLNDLFKDLAVMIEDQGTVVDRIDYNIERVSHSVQHGLTELEKAAKYQKTSRKMYVIACLIVIFLILFILLVITKLL